MEKFKQLGLSQELIKAVQRLKFTEPTEIQEKAIPHAIAGKDILGGSFTGSGKTFTFGAPIIEHCKPKSGLQALVLVPTRELAEQVSKSLEDFSQFKQLNILPVYGGVSINPQIDNLPYTDVVVGTPGRVLDHLERQTMDLSQISILVLDEADRMLDMGFIDDVRRIISQCPKKRQTMLFSATLSNEIRDIIQNEMNNPIEVSVQEFVDPSKLLQVYYDIPENMKFSLLVHLLKDEPSGLVMVFCNTQSTTDFVANNMKNAGIEALAIHGGLSQSKRNITMDRFHSNKAHVLVCTDVAARGLDVKDVSHVYNYNSPNEEKQYVHRIGRTARAGKEGKVINLISPSDHENFSRVLRMGATNIQRGEIPEFPQVQITWRQAPRRDGGNGFRRGGFEGRGARSPREQPRHGGFRRR